MARSAIGPAETELSRFAAGAENATRGHSSDAVVWEEVEERTFESAELTLAYSQGEAFRASILQLAVNVGAMLLAGVITLAIQRVFHRRRRAAHLQTLARRETGSQR